METSLGSSQPIRFTEHLLILPNAPECKCQKEDDEEGKDGADFPGSLGNAKLLLEFVYGKILSGNCQNRKNHVDDDQFFLQPTVLEKKNIDERDNNGEYYDQQQNQVFPNGKNFYQPICRCS